MPPVPLHKQNHPLHSLALYFPCNPKCMHAGKSAWIWISFPPAPTSHTTTAAGGRPTPNVVWLGPLPPFSSRSSAPWISKALTKEEDAMLKLSPFTSICHFPSAAPVWLMKANRKCDPPPRAHTQTPAGLRPQERMWIGTLGLTQNDSKFIWQPR